jgi:GNAT superfamily N-acetyltransferase
LSAPTDWTENTFHVTDDRGAVDFDFVVEMLRTSYWASNRSRDVIEASWRASLPFTMFDGEQRIGFARAVTDRATFSWIADVVVHPQHRRRGAGRFVMRCVIEHPDIARTKISLATRDAHSFYESIGFTRGEAMWKWPAGMSGPPG